MFSLTTISFMAVFTLLVLGSIFYHPMFGVIGYIFVYFTNPPNQWWGSGLASMDFRYGLIITLAVILGFFFHKDKLDYNHEINRQEVLFWLFIALIWLSIPLGLPQLGGENFALKLTKVAVFLFFFLRIVVDLQKYEIFLWTVIVISGLYLGYKTTTVSTAAFGRVDIGFGGADFREGNFLAAHFAATLPLIGVLFLKSSTKGKIVALLAGVLTVNAIVLCRSRGVFLALLVGVIAALFLAPKDLRKKIYLWVLVAIIGSFFLMDPGFISRMHKINPEISNLEEQDASASGRIMAWRAAIDMVSDHPLGIGQGNFQPYVGDYNPLIPHKDAHNTYLRCLAELGIQGFVVLMLIIISAFQTLRKMKKDITANASESEFGLHVYGVTISLIIFLTSSFFITEIYVEEFYWFLFLPLVIENAYHQQLAGTVAKEIPWDYQDGVYSKKGKVCS